MPNNQHAARLRAIADKYKNETGGWASDRAASIAALLAGAEALEAVEVAKAANTDEEMNDLRAKLAIATIQLRHIASGQSWSPTRDAATALARLEGK